MKQLLPYNFYLPRSFFFLFLSFFSVRKEKDEAFRRFEATFNESRWVELVSIQMLKGATNLPNALSTIISRHYFLLTHKKWMEICYQNFKMLTNWVFVDLRCASERYIKITLVNYLSWRNTHDTDETILYSFMCIIYCTTMQTNLFSYCCLKYYSWKL